MNPDYQLLDFGKNQKLERFNKLIVKRETVSANGPTSPIQEWQNSDLCFQIDGHWSGDVDENWILSIASGLRFELRTTATGQVGIFPEQENNWNWIADLPLELSGLKAINLFAYTGGTTLALAKRGVQVTHVDSAKSVVNWARKNAEHSGLDKAPIRWIVEDALTFVEREVNRGNHYDIVVADPPSFGRGPSKETWKIQRDMDKLLNALATVTRNNPKALVISCHTPEFTTDGLSKAVSKQFKIKLNAENRLNLTIPSLTGKVLESGICCRWHQD